MVIGREGGGAGDGRREGGGAGGGRSPGQLPGEPAGRGAVDRGRGLVRRVQLRRSDIWLIGWLRGWIVGCVFHLGLGLLLIRFFLVFSGRRKQNRPTRSFPTDEGTLWKTRPISATGRSEAWGRLISQSAEVGC